MKDMSKFQLILTGVFAAFIVIGVIVFSLFRAGSGRIPVSLTVWGTMDRSTFLNITKDITIDTKDQEYELSVEYRQVGMDAFDQAFIEALAAGRGPDLIMLPHDRILRHADKLFVIPFTWFSERQFRDTFAEGAEIFLTPDGTIAMPFLVDPLMMYWNRTLFSNAGISTPPVLWSELYTIVPRLTVREGSSGIVRSGVALGEFQNINNAKYILSALIMQAGSPITRWDTAYTGQVQQMLAERLNFPVVPAEAALSFYTEFSNPTKTFYSWNRSLQTSQNAFIAGDLAMYFGFASELPTLRARNPNLNFDVTRIPQTDGSSSRIVYGYMTGLAIPRSSNNAGYAFSFAAALTNAANALNTAKAVGLPPLRRDLLAQPPTDAFGAAFYDSALWSKAWYEPEYSEVNRVFRTLVESVTGGRSAVSQAVNQASRELAQLLERYNFIRR